MNTVKQPCQTCKEPKEMTIETRPFTKDEFDRVLPLLDKYGLTRQETDYIYNFYNRVFNEKKQPGCGKCFVNMAKRLKIKYTTLYN
jgi:hypothetical protein